MIRWRPPGPYEIAFSTRDGGVSEGPYASLNLGRMSGDDVDARRREPAPRLRRDRWRSPPARPQPAGSLDPRAPGRAGARGKPGDGLWTEEPDVPVLALDSRLCPDRARARRRRPARCRRAARRLAGAARWDRRAGGRGARRPAARGGRSAIGPCCYEVGADVAEPFRGRVRAGRAARQATSICGAPPTARSARRASKRSSASTSARIAIPSSSSRIAAPGCHGAARE